MQGKVTLRFVVNRDGSVDRIEVIKGVDPLDNEAVRVVKTLPKFKPVNSRVFRFRSGFHYLLCFR